jgi:hypothetical protein
VPHVEAPLSVLESMLTARIHLDDVTAEYGPLKVVPGSHRSGKALTLDLAPPVQILANRGDVLLMRPLLAHCSGKSHPHSTRHRRILHLEFTTAADLPDGYAWHPFIPEISGMSQAGSSVTREKGVPDESSSLKQSLIQIKRWGFTICYSCGTRENLQQARVRLRLC